VQDRNMGKVPGVTQCNVTEAQSDGFVNCPYLCV
jgi:hypothetical protein